MRLVRLVILSLAAFVVHLPNVHAAGCKAEFGEKMKSEGQRTGLSARILTAPVTVPVGQPFSAKVVICGSNEQAVDSFSIDATMPQHRHGMNYKPSVTSGDDRKYEATGLFFHMPGLWRFEVTVQSKGKPQRFTHDVIAK